MREGVLAVPNIETRRAIPPPTRRAIPPPNRCLPADAHAASHAGTPTISSRPVEQFPSSCVRKEEYGRPPMNPPSATRSTASPDVTEAQTADMRTSVPCVEHLPMARRLVQLDSLFPVSTPLRADHWEEELAAAGVLDRFAEVPKGLRNGFSIGLDSFALDQTFIPKNHYRTSDAHAFVLSKYAQEIKLGRLSPGFSPSDALTLFGPYRTAPLNVIASAGGKLRVTLDLS